MPDTDRKVIVTNGGSSAGWIVAIVAICALLIGGFVYRDAIFGGSSSDINIKVDLPGN
uniref:hypothetical protein n=1 Tax=Pararhizobium sp. IMCC3301 TaxID=3067904 RepID=UPI002740DAF0|nr:hypothetical protein [Pararhizobium sp. IMCC3301]